MEFGTVKYGHLRKWLHFRGVDDIVDCGNISFGDGDFTAMVLVRRQDNGVLWGGALNAYAEEHKGWYLVIRNDGYAVWKFGDGTNYTVIEYDLHNIYGNDFWNKDIFLAGVKGDKSKLYVNGELKAEQSYTQVSTVDFATLRLMKSVSYGFVEGNEYFVALYNRALSDAEHSQMCDYVMNGKGEMITDGLMLWYDGDSIDEGAGIWRDKSGNGNDGTIYGATYNSNWGTIKYGTIHYGV